MQEVVKEVANRTGRDLIFDAIADRNKVGEWMESRVGNVLDNVDMHKVQSTDDL